MRHLLSSLACLALAVASCSTPASSNGSCVTNADCSGADTCNKGHCQPPVSHPSSASSASSSSSSTGAGGNGTSGGRVGTSSGGAASSTGNQGNGGSTSTAGTSGSGSTGGVGTSGGTPGGSTSSGGVAGGTSGGSACATACNAPFTCDATSGLCKNQGIPQFNNVWVIVMENTSFSSLTATSIPYLYTLFTGASPGGTEMVRYQDTGVHPSLPNYLGLVGGDNFGITSDGQASSSSYQVAASNPDIASQLEGIGLTWHEYSEAQISACQLSDSGSDGTPPGTFASKHDPMTHFLITQGTASCTANDVSYEPETGMPGIAADIAAGNFFNYVFIAPNLCDDGHDTCTGTSIGQQNAWLQANVPQILSSSAFANNGFLYITWDEGSSDTDAIMAVALSPMLANPGGQDSGNYTHYSLLSTIEAGFGLTSLPVANGHNDPLMTSLWK